MRGDMPGAPVYRFGYDLSYVPWVAVFWGIPEGLAGGSSGSLAS